MLNHLPYCFLFSIRVVLEMFAETACLSRTRDDVGSLVNFGCLVRVDILQCPTSSVHLCNFRQFGQGILWLSFNRSEYKILFLNRIQISHDFFLSYCSWFRSLPLLICVCAHIRQCWKFAYWIYITWRHIIKQTNIVWSSLVCYSAVWLLPCA